ncbi:MAG: hypothetical protein J6A28_02815 [Clostridia bacterium]|nr:hypothetical protein [Clostridia bacterium]
MKKEKTFEKESVEKAQKEKKEQSILKNVAKIFSYGGLVPFVVGTLMLVGSVIAPFVDKEYNKTLDEKAEYVEEFATSSAYEEHVQQQTNEYQEQFLNNEISAFEYEGKIEMLQDRFYIEQVATQHDERIEECNQRLSERAQTTSSLLGAGAIAMMAGGTSMIAGSIAEETYYDKTGNFAFKDKTIFGKVYNTKHRKKYDYDENDYGL